MTSNSIVVIVAVVIDVNYWHLEFIPSVSLKLDRPETQAQVGTALMTTIELFEGTKYITVFSLLASRKIDLTKTRFIISKARGPFPETSKQQTHLLPPPSYKKV